MDAHNGELPHVLIAWAFVTDNPDLFFDTDGDDIDDEPNEEFIAAYYGATGAK